MTDFIHKTLKKIRFKKNYIVWGNFVHLKLLDEFTHTFYSKKLGERYQILCLHYEEKILFAVDQHLHTMNKSKTNFKIHQYIFYQISYEHFFKKQVY